MSIKKIQWFVFSIFLVVSCGCQDIKKQDNDETACINYSRQDENNHRNDETVCNFFRGFNTDEPWECYRITSKEGLFEIDLWIERYIDYLKYPSENLEIITDVIYSRRSNKRIYYRILRSVPIDTTIPIAFRKYKPHVSNESVEELKVIAKKYGIKMSTEEFELFDKDWWYNPDS